MNSDEIFEIGKMFMSNQLLEQFELLKIRVKIIRTHVYVYIGKLAHNLNILVPTQDM